MIKLVIPGRPISKSNFKLHNIHGQSWMPSKGKHSKYLAYENMIAGYINTQYDGPCIEEDLITILKLYFPNKRMGDLHNYPKSICDGIETVSYTHLTLPTTSGWCRSRWSPYH